MTQTDPHEKITHDRADEVVEIWSALRLFLAPAELEMEKLVGETQWEFSATVFPVALSVSSSCHIPLFCVDTYDRDELAFAIAYGLEMSPTEAFLVEAVGPVKPIFDATGDAWYGLAIAPFLGVAMGAVGSWRYATRFAERERDAIADAVSWVHRAGFDPNAGVSMFLKASGWAEQIEHPEKKEPSWSDKLTAGVLLLAWAPVGGVLAAAVKDDMPLIRSEERAAAVRAACVSAGHATRVG